MFAHLLLVSLASVAADALDRELEAVAKDIKAVMDSKRLSTATVGSFEGPEKLRGGGGAEITLKLAEQLKKLNVAVDRDRYHLAIRGSYAEHRDASGLLGVVISFRLVDEFGKELVNFDSAKLQRVVFGTEATPRLLLVSHSLPPSAGPEARSKDHRAGLDRDRQAVEGTLVRAAADSPFAVELLRKEGSTLHPVPVERVGARNLPFAEISKGSVFAVRLVNRSAHEAAANVTIDGVSVFAFSESKPAPTHWLVPAGGELIVPGWHRREGERGSVFEFKTVDFPEGAANRLGLKPSGDTGAIQVSFSASWARDADRPADDPITRAAGLGEEIRFQNQSVRRTIGQPRANVVVRYERAPNS